MTTLLNFVAYIDPASGFFVIQLIVAGVIGTVAFFRRSIRRALRRVFRSGQSTTPDQSTPPDQNTTPDQSTNR